MSSNYGGKHEPPHVHQVHSPPVPLSPYPYAPPVYTQKNSLGIVALVLGIMSFMCFGLLAGIPAIIVGRASENAQAQGFANNGTLGRVGWILGIVGSAVWLLIWLFYFLLNVGLLVLPLLILGTSSY